MKADKKYKTKIYKTGVYFDENGKQKPFPKKLDAQIRRGLRRSLETTKETMKGES